MGLTEYVMDHEVPGMLTLPFVGRVTAHAINRRQFPGAKAQGMGDES